jgi:hypothetical protein
METPYPLGLVIAQDPRNKLYGMREHLPRAAALPEFQYWTCRPALSQVGNSCVGYSMRTLLEATPRPLAVGEGPSGMELYRAALERDHIPGEQDTGTSLLAGAKAAQDLGQIREYVWADTIRDVAEWVLLRGTVVFGTVWLTGMFNPDRNGRLHLTGDMAGGHAYCVYGFHQASGYFRLQNTWSAGWSQRGRAWLWWKDAEDLLFRRVGECLAPTEP